MSGIFSRLLNKYVITALVAVMTIIVIFGLIGGFSQSDANGIFVAMSDATFVVGVIMSGVGGLLWASGQGAFDALTYSVSLMMRPGSKDWHVQESLYDYKERKSKKRAEYKHLLLVGVACLVIGIYFTLIIQLIF